MTDAPSRPADTRRAVHPWKLLTGAILLTGVLLFEVARGGRGAREDGPAKPAAGRDELWDVEKRTARIFTEASPAVVHILSLIRGRDFWTRRFYEVEKGMGSGFIWDEKGHVVTNFHVINGAERWKVTLADHTSWDAVLVGVSADKDLAVLRIAPPPQKALRRIPVGGSRELIVGQRVFAIGNPFGLDQTLTTGIISGLGREIRSQTGRPIQDVIQTDASINPGNSGGPLLDSSGRLIGVNTAIYSTSGSSAGVGFAIPSDTVSRIIPQLIEFGRVIRPGLGVTLAPGYWLRQYGLDGLLVWGVQRDGSADRAGILPTRRARDGSVVLGDIIIGVGKLAVRDRDDLFRALDRHRVGQAVTIKVRRQGREKELSVTLQAIE